MNSSDKDTGKQASSQNLARSANPSNSSDSRIQNAENTTSQNQTEPAGSSPTGIAPVSMSPRIVVAGLKRSDDTVKMVLKDSKQADTEKEK